MSDKKRRGRAEQKSTQSSSDNGNSIPLENASSSISFYVNNEQVTIENPEPTELLIDFLRYGSLGLTGTKLSCGEGGCGACTVMLSRYDAERGEVVDRAINACLRPVCSLDGMMVTTTEGIGSTKQEMDPVQYAIAAYNGSQCGFCTPGFVMNMFTMLRNEPKPTQKEVEDRFDGHICRCTGFRPILQAMKSFARDYKEHNTYYTNHPCVPADGVREAGEESKVVFPKALLEKAKNPRPLYFEGHGYKWFRPLTLAEVQSLKERYDDGQGNFKLVVGNTSIGIYKIDVSNPHILVDVSAIPELLGFSEDKDGFQVGAANTLQELIEYLDKTIARMKPEHTRGLTAMRRHILDVANLQVRNVGSIAGNIMMTRAQAETDSPFPSDIYMVFATLGVTITLASREFKGGRQTFEILELPAPQDLPKDAVAVSFHIPFTRSDEYVQTYKVAARSQNSHAIVNAGFRVAIGRKGEILNMVVCYGGLAPMTLRMTKTEDYMKGRKWDEETLSGALNILAKEVAARIKPMPGVQFLPAGYRESLTETLLYKFFLNIADELFPNEVQKVNRSGGEIYERPLSGGTQHVEVYPDEAPVGEPILRTTAFQQATGEMKYTQDLPLPPHGLEAAVVLSTKANASFGYRRDVKGISAHLAEKFPGVRAYISREDVPASNLTGLGGDDPIFADKEVIYYGQAIGIVVASDPWVAQTAARYVQDELITYPKVAKPVLTIDEALAEPDNEGIFKDQPENNHIPLIVRPGSDQKWLKNPDKPMKGCAVISGEQRTSPQAHFYMETQTCLAIPGEQDNMIVYSSTQQSAQVQSSISGALGIPSSSVQVYVRPLGGGFGGKQFRAGIVAPMAAVASWVLNRPVRLALDRNTDMAVVGKRHPFKGKYSVAFDKKGMLHGLKFELTSDGGCTYDCSFPVHDLAMQNVDNSYYVPTFETRGDVARTNNASNTAFRSFGTVQAILIGEEAIERVAHELGMTPEEVRYRNLYETSRGRSFQRTPYMQALKPCYIRQIWDTLWESSDFEKRQQEVERFNSQNRWRKRGISMIPLKYGIGYQPRSLDQGVALVVAYASDGSVLLQHGGIDSGQGINTKMLQIAAETLGIPMEWIRIAESSTETCPNATATAASSGSDLFGGAVQLACQKLRKRLEKYCEENKVKGWRKNWQMKWKEIVSGAYNARVDLTSEALFRTPHLGNTTGDHPYGDAFYYFSYSAAATEVEIDVLTGETTILRTDILFDAGKSLNPCLDVGQVEGAFVQGAGMMTSEQLMYEETGRLYSNGTWDYKPPQSLSIPIDFRVALNASVRNRMSKQEAGAAVLSSRALGEPPLVLATTVYFAIKHAIMSARRDQGDTSWFVMETPASVGRIQRACLVDKSALRL
ncbi:MAG TPA: molybdopterin cofactor-binding domain-containing protein [Pyrinomonadaceae bacterium]|nr:molybdopterin cofactor-binding domain-containing protein [Pyrinomonadaceae bacterium]